MKVKGVELGDECALCGAKENLEVHHIVPISKGGTNEIENLALLCKTCNRGISNKIVPVIEKQFKIGQFGGNGKRLNNLVKWSERGKVTITIKRETAEMLVREKSFGETWDDLLLRLAKGEKKK